MHGVRSMGLLVVHTSCEARARADWWLWLLLGVVFSSVGVVYFFAGFVVAFPLHPRTHNFDDTFLLEPSGPWHDQHEVAL